MQKCPNGFFFRKNEKQVLLIRLAAKKESRPAFRTMQASDSEYISDERYKRFQSEFPIYAYIISREGEDKNTVLADFCDTSCFF